MNKSDSILIGIVILIVLAFMHIYYNNNQGEKTAKVYYDGKEVLSIDLSQKEIKDYTVKGYNGDVIIKAGNGQIKVDDENSPLNLCSKQGFIKEAYESIICLPNKIVVQIETKSDIDAVVR